MNKQQKIDAYLDWTNNYVSIACFAEDRNLNRATASDLITEGRALHEKQVAAYAALEILPELVNSLADHLAITRLYGDGNPGSIREAQIRRAQDVLAKAKSIGQPGGQKPPANTEPQELAKDNFTVISVSSNTNSFGFKSIFLLNEQGEGWEILKSAYSGDTLPKRGDAVKRVGDRFQCGSYECPRRRHDCPPALAKKVIKEARG
jgi:hypothetical protein